MRLSQTKYKILVLDLNLARGFRCKKNVGAKSPPGQSLQRTPSALDPTSNVPTPFVARLDNILWY